MPRKYTPDEALAAFWSKVNKDGPTMPHMDTPCWVWTRSTNDWGYGITAQSRRLARAHRVAYELTFGPIPEGMCACHKCDNPPCCNPAHLWLGTTRQNTADMMAKGRKRPAVGNANGRTKLTEDHVRDIRRRHAAGITTIALAQMHGVACENISAVVKRKTWKHVKPEGIPNGQ